MLGALGSIQLEVHWSPGSEGQISGAEVRYRKVLEEGSYRVLAMIWALDFTLSEMRIHWKMLWRGMSDLT